VAGAITFLLMMYRRSPDPLGALLPACPFYTATGIHCPFCGGQAALHALLEGQWAEAWAANAFLCILPVLLLALVLEGRWRTVHQARQQSGWIARVAIPGIVVLFAAARCFG